MTALGQTMGSYRVVSKLGEGGMAMVYLAEHTLLGRKAAVKVLRPESSQNEQVVQRFFDEARTTSSLKHPGIVDVYDFGHADDSAFLVMEYLQGETLTTRLRRERQIPLPEALDITLQTASALGAAHAAGVVHRDLKPDNLFLVPDSERPSATRVKVLDFGIAKLSTDWMRNASDTQTGSALGTPRYMSPEQCRSAANVDLRTDIYSLGCVLYQMVCGTPPFTGESLGDLIAAHVHEPPPPPRSIEPNLPGPLEVLLLRMLAKQPDDRPASMEALAQEILAIMPQAPGTGYASRATRTGVPGPTPTTLGSSASEIGRRTAPPSSSGHGWRAYGVVAAVSLVAASIAVAVLQRTRPAHAPARPPKITQITVEATPAAARPDPTPAAATKAAPAAAKAPPAPRVTRTLESNPPGVDVYRLADGTRVGETPLVLTLARAEGEEVYVLRKSGFREERVQVPTDSDGTHRVELRLRPRTVPRSTARTVPRSTARTESAPPPAGPVKDGALDPFGD